MLNAVIFDLDGTLLDTKADFTLVLNALLSHHGRAAVSPLELNHTISSGAKAMVKLGFALPDDAAELPALIEDFLRDYELLLPNTQASLYEDIDLLIAALLEHDLAWGIMTNKARRFSAPLISQFESFSTSSVLVCPDDVTAGKPDPSGILKACELINVSPEQAVYVGDHPRDIEAANNAGVRGIAVRWGYLPQEPAPEQWGASFVADTPKILLDYLRRL